MDERYDDITPEHLNSEIWIQIKKFLRPHQKVLLKTLPIMALLGILDSSYPLLSKYAIDHFIEKNTLENLSIFAICFFLLISVNAGLVFAFIYQSSKAETAIAYDLRRQSFEQLQRLSLSYYDKKAVGWIMSRMTSDIYNLTETLCWALMDMSWGITSMIFMIAAMFWLNWKLALIACSVIPIIFIVSFYFQRKIIRQQRIVKNINSKITASYNEDIQGARTTKTMVREKLNFDEFSALSQRYRRESIRSTLISAIYLPSVLVLGSIGTGLALGIGGREVVVGALQFGTLAAFISYTVQFYEPIRMLAGIFSDFLSAQASAERIFSLLYEEPEIFDGPEILEKYGDTLHHSEINLPPIQGEVEFRNVSFHYHENEPILKNFSLKVEQGETVALVGETGGGKSTIVNLFSRFYEPVSGEILIDGQNYKNYPQRWIHDNLGYVLQTPYLFSGTIRENLLYGKLDATEEEMIRACKSVNAHSFIMKTEKGYDSEVGEGGSLLSTGQKQLISFARAIIRNPKLFVLDEATSSVDTETEKMIQDAISSMLKNRTAFIIAHRLSTIRNADKILVIKDGKIEEIGNHKELIQKKGAYYRLYVNQFIEQSQW